MGASSTPGPGPTGRGMKLAVAGAGILVIAAGAAFYYASSLRRPAGGEEAVRVVIQADRCEPNALTVPAGRATFEIVNASDRVVEWEILDGVMVVEERENIAPGLSSRLTARLSPGTFQITCGLLNNPRGTLTVTPSAQSQAEAKRPPATAILGALAEYQAYLALEAADFAASAQDFTDAVRAGDVAAAKAAFDAAQVSYLHVAPAARRFSDLDTAIEARADYFSAREQDPNFGGFHKLAPAVASGEGLAALQPVADKLARDAGTLSDRLRSLTLTPDALAAGSVRSLDRSADFAAVGGDGETGAQESAAFGAEIDGVAKVVTLLGPLVKKADPDLAARTDAALAAARAAAAGLATAPDQKAALAALATGLRALSADLAKFNTVLSLE